MDDKEKQIERENTMSGTMSDNIDSANAILIGRFGQPHNFSDIVLMIEGKELHTHKCILSMLSPFFKAMFDGDFKEKKERPVEFPEKNYEEVSELINMLYPPYSFKITDVNVMPTLVLANEWQIANIKEQCEQLLQKQLKEKGVQISLEYLAIAERYHCQNLHEDSLMMAIQIAQAKMKKNAFFTELSENTKQQIRNQRLDLIEKHILQFKEQCDRRQYSTTIGAIKYLLAKIMK